MKTHETDRTYRFEWNHELGSDTAYVTLRPGDPENGFDAVARVRRRAEIEPLETMDFFHPDDLEEFGNALVKLAGEMRKWPEFKPARKAARK